MSRLELLTPEGLRIDGRRPGEIRKLTCRTGVMAQADGSSFVELGNTKVLATVYGPREPRHRGLQHDQALINVEYNVAPFSMSERKKRSKSDKRSLELSSAVKQTFEPVILTNLYPRSQIDIYLQLLQHDGGTLQACINASTLALIDAGIPLRDYVCATTAGCIESTPILDLNQVEESSESPELTVAILPRSEKITLLQMESRLQVNKFEAVMNLAKRGCGVIHETLEECIREAAQACLAKS